VPPTTGTAAVSALDAAMAPELSRPASLSPAPGVDPLIDKVEPSPGPAVPLLPCTIPLSPVSMVEALLLPLVLLLLLVLLLVLVLPVVGVPPAPALELEGIRVGEGDGMGLGPTDGVGLGLSDGDTVSHVSVYTMTTYSPAEQLVARSARVWGPAVSTCG
jgi:hypothetical protein